MQGCSFGSKSPNGIHVPILCGKVAENLMQAPRGYTTVQRKILSQSRVETDTMNLAQPLLVVFIIKNIT